mgnify:CR=1 FL=1
MQTPTTGTADLERRLRRREGLRRALTYLFLSTSAGVVPFPFYWMLLTSPNSSRAHNPAPPPAFSTPHPPPASLSRMLVSSFFGQTQTPENLHFPEFFLSCPLSWGGTAQEGASYENQKRDAGRLRSRLCRGPARLCKRRTAARIYDGIFTVAYNSARALQHDSCGIFPRQLLCTGNGSGQNLPCRLTRNS